MRKQLGQQQKEAWGALLLGHAALTRRIDRAMVQEGFLTLQVYDVLLALEDAPKGRLRMSDLASYLVFDASSLTRLIDRLERAGYVRREAHPTDRRSVFAVITPNGLEARLHSWPRYRELIQEHFGQYVGNRLATEFKAAVLRATTKDGSVVWPRPEPKYTKESDR